MLKNVKAFILITAVLLTVGCKSKSYQPSTSEIGQVWLDIKTELDTTDMDNSGLYAKIEELDKKINSFINSPIGYMYRTHRRGDMSSVLKISAVIKRLENTIKNGDKQEVNLISFEIDKAVNVLQRVDAELSGVSQFNYFILFFFFSIIVMAIILILSFLQDNLKKEMLEHQLSLSFSREIMLAQEHERARIARELHDTVAQDLLRLSIQTEVIKQEPLTDKQNRLCADVMEGQAELINKIRSICNVLIPPDFQPDGNDYIRLPDALKTLCAAFKKRTGIECNITIHKSANFSFLDVDMQLHCFRIVQECLANVEKHSEAKEVQVLVRGNAEGKLLLFVTDNGKGFEGAENDLFHTMRAKGHFGLWNMQERAVSMNAVFSIDSAAGEGTSVKLIISPPPHYFRRGGVKYELNFSYRRSPYAYQCSGRMA